MALPPTIPTSFVPHSNAAARSYRTNYLGALAFLAYAILAVAFALAFGVFFYGQILAAEKVSKDKELKAAQEAIDPKIVEGFVRLRDRLLLGQALLDNHVALTGFFATLEKILPETVRMDSMHLTVDDTNRVRLEASGVAKSFNSLAVASNQFGTDGRIKDAIFSALTLKKDNSISFSLAATLDPALITFTP